MMKGAKKSARRLISHEVIMRSSHTGYPLQEEEAWKDKQAECFLSARVPGTGRPNHTVGHPLPPPRQRQNPSAPKQGT